MDPSQMNDATSHGFRYFYELTVGSVILVFVSFQSWMALKLLKHERRLAQIDVERLSRADFEQWSENQTRKMNSMHEENQLQMDELRASSIASGQQAVETMRESQTRLEEQLRHGLNRLEDNQRELLLVLAKAGLRKE